MRNRFMRTIVFFDLPTIFERDKRNYAKFRKFLVQEGFLMMQESVYSKLTLNSQQSELLIKRIKRNSPSKGLVQILVITENQYAKIINVIGEPSSKIINSEDRLVIL